MDGLDKFREAFAEYSDNYVVIGGAACDMDPFLVSASQDVLWVIIF